MVLILVYHIDLDFYLGIDLEGILVQILILIYMPGI